jgi:hypothetical protein
MTTLQLVHQKGSKKKAKTSHFWNIKWEREEGPGMKAQKQALGSGQYSTMQNAKHRHRSCAGISRLP